MQPNNQNTEQPEQSPPPQSPQPRLVIQPLSSEDAIREAARSAPAPEEIPGYAGSFSDSEDTSASAQRAYEPGSFIDKPIRHLGNTATQNFAKLTVPVETPAPKKSKKTSIGVLVGVLLMTVFAVGAYFFFLDGKVFAGDLMRETDGNTTYLRPKQWRLLPSNAANSMKGYGDWVEAKGKLGSAAVVFKESPAVPGFANASDGVISELRKQMQGIVGAQLTSSFGGGSVGACGTLSAPVVEADEKKNDTTTGLLLVRTTCQRDDGLKAAIKMRMVLGKDGGLRLIMIMARDDIWRKNDTEFQAILESIEQLKGTAETA